MTTVDVALDAREQAGEAVGGLGVDGDDFARGYGIDEPTEIRNCRVA